jgi:hypothetical protein
MNYALQNCSSGFFPKSNPLKYSRSASRLNVRALPRDASTFISPPETSSPSSLPFPRPLLQHHRQACVPCPFSPPGPVLLPLLLLYQLAISVCFLRFSRYPREKQASNLYPLSSPSILSSGLIVRACISAASRPLFPPPSPFIPSTPRTNYPCYLPHVALTTDYHSVFELVMAHPSLSHKCSSHALLGCQFAAPR